MYIGSYANYKDCTLADISALKPITTQRYSDDEYTYKRIYECVMWGYNNAGNICQKNSKPEISQGRKATYNTFLSRTGWLYKLSQLEKDYIDKHMSEIRGGK